MCVYYRSRAAQKIEHLASRRHHRYHARRHRRRWLSLRPLLLPWNQTTTPYGPWSKKCYTTRMNRNEFFKRYAKVIATVGLAVHEGQEVVIRSLLETADFVPFVAAECYRRGASYVHTLYRDYRVARARLENANEETLTRTPAGFIAEQIRLARTGGAALTILGEDPAAMEGIDARRLGTVSKAMSAASRELRTLAMTTEFPWCGVSLPNLAWARKVYPGKPDDKALSQLFAAVATACRLDRDDPVSEWHSHIHGLRTIADWLTAQAFTRLEYRAPGTDFRVGLPRGHQWPGGSAVSAAGVSFVPNMPTEEVFTAPNRLEAEGSVTTTRPMILNGVNVGIGEFTLEGGKIVAARCERMQDVLERELDLDDGARYLGEVAFVTEDSPVAQLMTTFYDPIYDENAGCHLAFGAAYPLCIDAGVEMSPAELRSAGLNTSIQHFDFTVGSDELSVVAYGTNGDPVQIIDAGRWGRDVMNAISPSSRHSHGM